MVTLTNLIRAIERDGTQSSSTLNKAMAQAVN